MTPDPFSSPITLSLFLLAFTAVTYAYGQPPDKFIEIRSELIRDTETLKELVENAKRDIPELAQSYRGLDLAESLKRKTTQKRIDANNFINKKSPNKQKDRQDYTALSSRWGRIHIANEVDRLVKSQKTRPLGLLVSRYVLADYIDDEGDITLPEINRATIALREDKRREILEIERKTSLPQSIIGMIPSESEANAKQGLYRILIYHFEPVEIRELKKKTRKLTALARNTWPNWSRDLGLKAQDPLNEIEEPGGKRGQESLIDDN